MILSPNTWHDGEIGDNSRCLMTPADHDRLQTCKHHMKQKLHGLDKDSDSLTGEEHTVGCLASEGVGRLSDNTRSSSGRNLAASAGV